MNQSAELKKIKEFYDHTYYKNAIQDQSENSHHHALLKRLGVEKEMTILDVACGKGEWLKTCQNAGALIYGIDLSDKAISICKESMPEGTFLCQPAEHLDFPDNHFDIITCLGSLEHFTDQRSALKEMVRVARHDAKLLILVPNSDFLTRKLGLYKGTNQTVAKEDVKTLDEWNSLFTDANLEVQNQWKDLHILTKNWIFRNGWSAAPIRLLQALLLTIWPIKWQYQVYHLCTIKTSN
ncbi:MAG: SAM-dependent methyltransferase [Gammaproteobacteria bacterium]|nr:MAG: SAM-dependent methyltransferase [Pseudomonadota bacterium]PIE38239.1 MAG: SAM-dependent methyltransferase [Gammaproteobacteria bacterium]